MRICVYYGIIAGHIGYNGFDDKVDLADCRYQRLHLCFGESDPRR